MMPETYTPEQIEKAIKLLTVSAGMKSGCWVVNDPIPETVILSALSTFEKNNADWQEYNAELLHRAETAERERDALKAQVAELEARLQGAADDKMDQARDSGAWWWVQKIRARNPSHRNSWRWSNKDAARRLDEYFKELLSTAVIVGKKEG